jgi:hypothetical protein
MIQNWQLIKKVMLQINVHVASYGELNHMVNHVICKILGFF